MQVRSRGTKSCDAIGALALETHVSFRFSCEERARGGALVRLGLESLRSETGVAG